jgi:hypothetical protein
MIGWRRAYLLSRRNAYMSLLHVRASPCKEKKHVTKKGQGAAKAAILIVWCLVYLLASDLLVPSALQYFVGKYIIKLFFHLSSTGEAPSHSLRV